MKKQFSVYSIIFLNRDNRDAVTKPPEIYLSLIKGTNVLYYTLYTVR